MIPKAELNEHADSLQQGGEKPSPWAVVAAEMYRYSSNKSPAADQNSISPENGNDDPVKSTPAENQDLEKLRRAIELHENFEKSKSYLARLFDTVYNPDSKSLKDLKSLYDSYTKAEQSGDENLKEDLQGQIEDRIKADIQSIASKEKVDRLGAGFTKTAFLFVQGYIGLAGAIGAYSLDQMRPGDPIATQILDGVIGAAKGAAMKEVVSLIGHTGLPIAAKGVAFGVSSRLLEMGLNSDTYFDPTTNSYKLQNGISNTLLASFNPQSLMTDAIIFSSAQGLISAANGVSGHVIGKSPFLTTVTSGYVFGASSGALQELNRQQSAGEKLDINKILWESTINGTITALAASIGGIQAEVAWRKSSEYLFQKLADHGGKFTFEKTKYYEIKAREVSDPKGELVKTLENAKGEFAPKGSWVITPEKGDVYPLSPTEFAIRWQAVPGKPGYFSPRPVPTTMVELIEPTVIQTKWGEMRGAAGDFLARYGPGNFAIVNRAILPSTYAGSDAASIAKLQHVTANPVVKPITNT